MGAGVSVAAGDLQSATDRLIVKFKTPLSQAERASPRALQRLQTLGVSGIVGRPMANGAYVVTMSESRQRQAWLDVMNQLSFDPDVAYVEPDLLMVPTADPYYDFQWYLQSPLFGINADNAWNFSTGSGAVIAVLDTGILAHPDLIANTLAGYDFVSDLFMANDGNGRDNNPLDPGDGVTAGACGGGQPPQDRYSSWHGSHVAGIAAALDMCLSGRQVKVAEALEMGLVSSTVASVDPSATVATRSKALSLDRVRLPEARSTITRAR